MPPHDPNFGHRCWTVLNEAVDATLGDYTSLIGRDDDVSVTVAARPQRTSIYSVPGRQGTLVYGGGYQHKLETETFGETFFPSNVYHGDFIPLGGSVGFSLKTRPIPTMILICAMGENTTGILRAFGLKAHI